MNLAEVLKIAIASLTANKLRSLLTMLGVIIGVAAVIVMVSISAGTEATIAEQINGLGSNLLFINSAFTRGGPGQGALSIQGGLVYADVAAIRDQVNGVAGVSVEQQASADVKLGTATLEGVTVVGTTPDYTTVRNVAVANGRFITEQDNERAEKVVVLGSKVAEELFGQADPVGQTLYVNNTQMVIVGVLAPKGLSGGTDFDQLIYTPINVVFKKLAPSQFARIMGDRVRTIYVSVDGQADMDTVKQQVSLLLANRHGVSLDAADFAITTQEDIIETQAATTESFRTLLGWVAGVSLIVGGIGIMNIMLVSVTERTREIGLRQAVGATPGDIQVQFLAEALMLSLFGGLIGVLAGVGGAQLFGHLSGMRTVVMSYSILLSFTSAALIGIVFGFIPAQKAAQLDPIVALRHE
ncbi:MAG TPA: ABC transporter permease [Anaerolineaceae bacterium]|nr:ABC transporter permease [Anaerolineaceae bacterium]